MPYLPVEWFFLAALVLPVLAIPLAVAGWRRGRRRPKTPGPWCFQCHYSLHGDPAAQHCPACGTGRDPARPEWPRGHRGPRWAALALALAPLMLVVPTVFEDGVDHSLQLEFSNYWGSPMERQMTQAGKYPSDPDQFERAYRYQAFHSLQIPVLNPWMGREFQWRLGGETPPFEFMQNRGKGQGLDYRFDTGAFAYTDSQGRRVTGARIAGADILGWWVANGLDVNQSFMPALAEDAAWALRATMDPNELDRSGQSLVGMRGHHPVYAGHGMLPWPGLLGWTLAFWAIWQWKRRCRLYPQNHRRFDRE